MPVGQTELKAVEQFSYLGSIISHGAKIDKEMDNILARANSILADSTNMSGKTGTSRKSPRSRYIKLIYSALSCMMLSPGSHITITCTSSSIPITDACTPSTKSVGMTVTNTQVLDIAEVTSIEPGSSKYSCIGLDMTQGWKTTTCQSSCCMVNCPWTVTKEVHRGRYIKTLQKSPHLMQH